MNIKLKNVKIFNSLSEETICFKADVYLNNVKIAHAQNTGKGGANLVQPYEGTNELLRSINHNVLDDIIDDLIDIELDKKHQNKIKKECLNNIVFGKIGEYYKSKGFKNTNIETLKSTKEGMSKLTKLIFEVKKEMKEGEVIFNDNLK